MRLLRSRLSRLARISICLALAFATLGAQRAAPALPLLYIVDRNDDARPESRVRHAIVLVKISHQHSVIAASRRRGHRRASRKTCKYLNI